MTSRLIEAIAVRSYQIDGIFAVALLREEIFPNIFDDRIAEIFSPILIKQKLLRKQLTLAVSKQPIV